MPFKPIDFQLSVPRAPENASQQSQMNHRPALEQTILEKDTAKQTEQLRNRNSAVEQSGNRGITPNRERESRSPSKRKHQRTQEQSLTEPETPDGMPHPYKGKHIDFSL